MDKQPQRNDAIITEVDVLPIHIYLPVFLSVCALYATNGTFEVSHDHGIYKCNAHHSLYIIYAHLCMYPICNWHIKFHGMYSGTHAQFEKLTECVVFACT